MTSGPTSSAYLGDHLHNHPASYWCPDCHRFMLDCDHLVEPLNAPSVILRNWLIQKVAYDRQRLILELEMNTGERYQHFGVSRRVAIGLVDPCGTMFRGSRSGTIGEVDLLPKLGPTQE